MIFEVFLHINCFNSGTASQSCIARRTPGWFTADFPGHFQRFDGQSAVRRERHGPAYWFSCEQVENNGEVRPALTRPDIGHITAPHLIWLGHGELPFKVVRSRLLRRDRPDIASGITTKAFCGVPAILPVAAEVRQYPSSANTLNNSKHLVR
ncbi:hypothetical protein C4A43_03349 [Escherichia coli]|nr:hypothetical protein C4A43_03349 [Escherichia coli]